jgi:hypothetical protein
MLTHNISHTAFYHHHDNGSGIQNTAPTLAALMSSSATHSAIVLMFLKAASRAPVHSNQIA